MNGQGQRFVSLATAFLIAALLGGCSADSQRLKIERDALIAQNNEAQDLIDRLRASIDALNQENEALRRDLATAPPEVTTIEMGSFGEGVDVIPGVGKITLRVAGDVLFAPGKVELKAAAKSTLASIADAIQREYAGRRIRVEGYTDTDPIKKSSWKDNLELSLQRAAAVYRELEAEGLPAESMYAAGYGEQRARETKEKSRRVEIVVLIEDQ